LKPARAIVDLKRWLARDDDRQGGPIWALDLEELAVVLDFLESRR